MNEQILYPALLIIGGILTSTISLIVLIRFSKKIVKFFGLYPESKRILNLSLSFISWFVGIIILLVFVRLALRLLNLEFTMKVTEEIIKLAPKYILAILLLLTGFYITRLIRERSKDSKFEFKERILLIMDLIVHMTFIFTALYTIGVNVIFFLELYRMIIWIVGGIVALIVSMTIGIPLGISIYEKMKKEEKIRRKQDL